MLALLSSFPCLAAHGNDAEEALGTCLALSVWGTALGFFACFAILIQAVVSFVLMRVLQRVPEPHRKLDPALAWLLLVPCFSLVWNFFLYPAVSASLRSYHDSAGRSDAGDCGRAIAIAYAICAALSWIPCLNYATGPASLVLLILFLVKAHELAPRASSATA